MRKINPEIPMQRWELIVHGNVQEVYFREFVNKFFENWNKCSGEDERVTGSVGNIEDGTVAVVVEGEEYILEKVLPLFYMGSPKSIVERVEENKIENIKEREFKGFDRAN